MTTRQEMTNELRDNGPFLMGLRIYEDFMNYASGIYTYETGDLVGGHAMKLVGFGEDQEFGFYWVLQNQWSNDWGERGYIKIKEGEIGIDSVGLSCQPDLKQAHKDQLLI